MLLRRQIQTVAKPAEIFDNNAVEKRSFFRAIQRCECLLLLLFLAQACAAQSFIFVSPNTRDHMTDAEAFAAQNSFEQRNFLAVAKYLGRRVCKEVPSADAGAAAVKVFGGEGLDGHDTENMAMIAGCGNERSVYLAELMARYGRQKWVLVFSAMPNAAEQLVVITLPAMLQEEAVNQMHKHNLVEGTVIAEGNGSRIYIWLQDHSQDAQIHALSEENQGSIQVVTGRGQLIGDDDRARAQRIFDKALHAYERQNHVAFSQQLQSKKLRRMGGNSNHKIRNNLNAALRLQQKPANPLLAFCSRATLRAETSHVTAARPCL